MRSRLIGIALALVAADGTTGIVRGRRLARPFQELADAVTALGKGRFDHPVPHYANAEAEAIASALRRSSAELEHLVRREREFRINAAHELLTPLTALTLQMEDLNHWPETSPEMAEELRTALATIERLATTVHGLIEKDRAARRAANIDVDLSELTARVVARWQSESKAQRREIRVETPGAIAAKLSPDEYTQVLDALLDNALRHGQGTVVVDCADIDTHLRVRVTDESPSVGRSNVMHRQGPGPVGGLARLAELAEAQGGYLVRDDHPTTRFVLMLPKPQG